MKCPKCGKEAMSISLISGKVEPCGCITRTKEERVQTRRMLAKMNKIFREVTG